MRFTLDHNCLIDLEEEREAAAFVRALAGMADQGLHKICVPASAGAERLPDGSTAASFQIYQSRIEQLGLANAIVLAPLMRVDMGFFGFSVLSGPELEELEQQIRRILFPTMPHNPSDLPSVTEVEHSADRWRNATLDVDAMWSHIHYQCDVFVTSDRNFLKEKKRASLIALGAKDILNPSQAARLAAAA